MRTPPHKGDTTHPLADAFGRYLDFFNLFEDFAGYLDFWHLQDLVDSSGDVKLFLPSENFTLPSIPQSVDDYLDYSEHTIDFVKARNKRIHELGL